MSYLSQSPNAISSLSKKVQAALALRNLSHEFYYQKKYDGVSGIVLTGLTESKIITRVGTDIVSMDHIGDDLLRIFGPERVIFGEFWKPDTAQSTINGSVMRHAPDDTMGFVVFDAIERNEYEAGVSDTPFWQRYAAIERAFNNPFTVRTAAYYPWGWSCCTIASTYAPGTYGEYSAFTKQCMEANPGLDGGILRDPAAPWVSGKDGAGFVIKDKPTISFDLEVIGVEEGKGKNKGRLGALLCRYKEGKTLKVSGMTDAQREEWWTYPGSIIGCIIQLDAMGFSSGGSLREPRFKGIRTDKDKPDF